MDNAITSLGLFPLELMQPLSTNTNFVALLPTLPFSPDSSVGLLNLVLDILVSATTLLSAYTSKMKDGKKWEVFWRIYLSSFLLGAVSFFLFQIASSKTLDLLLAKSALWLGLAVISFYFLTLSTSYSLAKIAAPQTRRTALLHCVLLGFAGFALAYFCILPVSISSNIATVAASLSVYLSICLALALFVRRLLLKKFGNQPSNTRSRTPSHVLHIAFSCFLTCTICALGPCISNSPEVFSWTSRIDNVSNGKSLQWYNLSQKLVAQEILLTDKEGNDTLFTRCRYNYDANGMLNEMVLHNSQNQPIAYYSTNFENDDDLLRFLSKNNSSYHLAGTISPETPGTISSLCERADYGNARWVVRHRSTFGTAGIPVETDCTYYDDDMNEVMHGERTYDEKGILVASHFYEYKGDDLLEYTATRIDPDSFYIDFTQSNVPFSVRTLYQNDTAIRREYRLSSNTILLAKKLGETSYGDIIGQLNLPDGAAIEVTLGDFLDGFQSLPLENSQLQIFTINSNGEESTQDFPLEQ